MVKKSVILFLLSFVLLACSPPLPILKIAEIPRPSPMVVRILMPGYFTSQEQIEIRKGIHQWESSLPTMLTVEWSDQPEKETIENQRRIQDNEWYKENNSGLTDDVWKGCSNVLVLVRMTSDHPMAKKREGWLGWTVTTCHVKYVVLVVDRLTNREGYLRRTAAHEFGHVLGLDHVGQRDMSIMYGYAGAGDSVGCVSKYDRRAFCSRWGYDSNLTVDPEC